MIELGRETATCSVSEAPVMGWITPTSHADPKGEWSAYPHLENYRIENAYNGTKDDRKMAMALWLTPEQNLTRHGDYWSGWLELFTSEPVLSNKIREASVPSNYARIVQIKVKYGGAWHTIYTGAYKSLLNWHELSLGSTYLVEGMGFRFERPMSRAGIEICYDFYEGEIYGGVV